MSITSVDKDFDTLTLVLVSDFEAPADQVWDLWADPRKLERWWGPPTYPATFEQHDLTPGGDVTYFMTGPEGDVHRGWWKVNAVEPVRLIEFTDGFADAEGNPVDSMGTTTARVEFSERDGGTRMEMRSTFESREQMQKMDEMGMEQGLREAIGQMDALLT